MCLSSSNTRLPVKVPQFLVSYLQAISSPAALCPLACPVCCAVAGAVALGPLYCLNQFRLLHIPRRNTVILGLVLYLAHCHWSFNYFYRSHVFLLFNCVVVLIYLYLRGPCPVPFCVSHIYIHSYFGSFASPALSTLQQIANWLKNRRNLLLREEFFGLSVRLRMTSTT
jgi:hypothetical protein